MKIVDFETFQETPGPFLFAYKKQPWALQIKRGDGIKDQVRVLWELDTRLTEGDTSMGIYSKTLKKNKDERMYIVDSFESEWDIADDDYSEDEGYIIFEEYEAQKIIASMIRDLRIDADFDWVNSLSIRLQEGRYMSKPEEENN